MKITRDQALQYVTDRLCNELDEQKHRYLQLYLARNPDLAEEVRELEAVWEAMELLREDKSVLPPLPRLCKIVIKERESDELSEDELDWAAGGVGRLTFDPNEPED